MECFDDLPADSDFGVFGGLIHFDDNVCGHHAWISRIFIFRHCRWRVCIRNCDGVFLQGATSLKRINIVSAFFREGAIFHGIIIIVYMIVQTFFARSILFSVLYGIGKILYYIIK